MNDRLISSFAITVGDTAAIVAASSTTLTVDWPELDNRVDNFILDNTRGTQLMSRLVGEKPIFYQDGENGLRIFRNRTVVNAGSPYDLTFESGEDDTDGEVITRLRLEGAEVAEVTDFDLMRQYGNLYAVKQSEELNTSREFEVEASRLLNELLRKITTTRVSGAADLRIEPNDQIEVYAPSEHRDDVRQMIVDTISFRMQITNNTAIFDMEVDGTDA